MYKKQDHTVRATGYALLVILLVLVTRYALRVTHYANAGTAHTVSGWAWADAAGWISFNCTNVTGECDRSDYGVNVSPTTGVFSGYAWADTVGWISFTRDAYTGTPPATPFNGSEDYLAQWNKSNNSVTGWAKILSLGDRGWLQFRTASLNPAAGKITGWMWNGNTDGTGIGWVQLTDVTVAQSVINLPPQTPTITEVNNTTVTEGTTIDTGRTELASAEPGTALQPIFKWSSFTDPNGISDSQQAYQIVVERRLPDGTWSTVYEPGPVENSGSAFRYPSAAPALEYDATYRWTVRVQDSTGAWSSYAEPIVFATPSQPLPQLADIVPTGTATAGQTVALNGNVTVPEGTTITKYQWDFGDGQKLEGSGPNYVNPEHRYATDGTYTVTLTVTDSAEYTVTKQMTVTVQKKVPLPIWRRIIPF